MSKFSKKGAEDAKDARGMRKVPTRQYGSKDSRLPEVVPIIGLGCSSFSNFFWSPDELAETSDWSPESLDKAHPRVQEWIKTIRYAVECGIFLLGK